MEDDTGDTSINCNFATDSKKKVLINAKNAVSRGIPDYDDNNTIPSLHTKLDETEENSSIIMRCTIVNDELAISSNLTMNTRMDTVESNMVTTNTNIENLDNSVNRIRSHVLAKTTQEIKHGSISSYMDLSKDDNG